MMKPLLTCLLILLATAHSSATEVRWMWSGAQTPDSVRIKVKLSTPEARPLSYVPSGDVGVSPKQATSVSIAPAGTGWIADYHLRELQPATNYHYTVGGIAGRVSTLPAPGPASFTIALSSCADTGSAHKVFQAIAAHGPLFFLHMGDLHYEDIAVNDIVVFHAAIDRALTSPTQAALFRSTAVPYMWDDHDYGPNNSDSSSPSREASRRAYREAVPHHPLVVHESGPVYHAFSVGRVRFILTDLRSERAPLSVPEGSGRSMMGAAQKEWFKAELIAARDSHALTVWVNTVPWIGDDAAKENEDRWTGFVTERAELSAFIEANDIRNLCVISGDSHMLAIDDGTNNRYGPAGRPLFPVFHAAALDRKGSVKGGPYSHGTFPGPGHYGLMRVVDDGGEEVRVEWSGRNHEGMELLRHHFTVTVPSSRH